MAVKLLFCVALSLSTTLLTKVLGQSKLCGGRITEVRAISYPDLHNKEQYKNNIDCIWIIVAHATKRIEITVSYIDLEPHSRCIYDYVKIYQMDSNFENGQLLGLYCGYLIYPNPSIIHTQRNVATVEFHSDEKNTATGFKIESREIEDFLCVSYEVSIIGTIQSLDANNDGYYDNDVDCFWTISWPHVDIDVIRQFYVARMDIQWSPDCETDYLEILEEGTRLGIFCGREIPPLYIQQTAALFVRFHSDSSINLKGFLAIYAAKDNQCGGILTSKEGEITSADNNKDGFYDSNMNCWWAVVAPENMVVSFEVSEVKMEGHPNCDYEFVAFFDGNADEDGFIFAACGFYLETIGPFVTETNILLVQFLSDDMYPLFRGFRITYIHIKAEFYQTTEATTVKLASNVTTRLPKQGPGKGISITELSATQHESGFDFTSSKDNFIPVIFTGLMFAMCL